MVRLPGMKDSERKEGECSGGFRIRVRKARTADVDPRFFPHSDGSG